MPMTFDHEDAAYQSWIDTHQDGFVVNCYRNLSPAYLMLHRVRCGTISGKPARGNTWTTGEFVKVCSVAIEALEHWVGREANGTLQPCGLCRPTNAPGNKIPDFHSRDEEAEFWDTHEVTDYLHELRTGSVGVAPGLASEVLIQLDSEESKILRRIADERGIDLSTLGRMWIKERLRSEA
jgi:hypothetical protein